MKKWLIFLLLILFGTKAWAMQAVMFGIESAKQNGTNIDLVVIVCYSGAEYNNGIPSVQAVPIPNIDPTSTISQLQTAIAAGIRAVVQSSGYVIPANGVTLLGMSKG